MYAGHVACCLLVSYVECALLLRLEKKTRHMDGWLTVTLCLSFEVAIIITTVQFYSAKTKSLDAHLLALFFYSQAPYISKAHSSHDRSGITYCKTLYRISSNRSRVSYTSRVSNTSRRSDFICSNISRVSNPSRVSNRSRGRSKRRIS